MQMTDGEICRVYKSAKDKKQQASILADINGCSTRRILSIVDSEERKKEKRQSCDSAKWQPTAEQKALIERLEELDAMIKPLEEEYRRTAAALMEIGGADAGRDIKRD